MKRCVIQFNGGGGFANFAAESLEMMPESGSLIAAYDADGKIAGVFDLSCILSIYLSDQKP